MKLLTFILINFIVSFLSDIVLNDISTYNILNSEIINSLKPYFKNKSIIYSGLLAAITVVIVLVANCLITKYLYGFYNPANLKQLLIYSIIAFPIGFIADIVIDKLNIFGHSLDNYYRVAGVGLWGAIAYLFSILISYIIQKYLVPLL
jgi:hypothetical protein